ncbi:MAG: SGNH/GDSL hydrolase family protein [Rhodoferax sp.]|nr:SGNH/GDSL hydrolase family protein [Rhodoferax sp.]
MRQFKILGIAVAATLLVAACGGGSDSVQAPAIKYTSLVSFGDSLSDVGTYKVGAVAALGGGTYSVNGITGVLPSKNWTELMAAQIGVAAPCPAQTGLNSAAALGGPVAVVDQPSCRNYAQGGARVTDPVGPGSASAPVNSPLGQLTVPIVTQIATHLGRVGSFSGTELVTVMAGGNDALRLLDTLVVNATAAGSQAFASSLISQLAAGATNPVTAAQAIGLALQTEANRVGHTDQSVVGAAVGAAAIQPGNSAVANPAVYDPMVASAQAAGAAAGAAYAKANGAAEAVFPMGEAGKQLAAYIKTQIVGKGAKYVAVVNLPDLSATPSGKGQSVDTQGLILNMVIYFNEVLAYELRDIAGVQIIDAFTEARSQIADPTAYGLTNVITPACNLNAPANGLATSPTAENGTSLVCNASNLKVGDVSKYLFADTVHPTPYGYKLLAELVTRNLTRAGWL